MLTAAPQTRIRWPARRRFLAIVLLMICIGLARVRAAEVGEEYRLKAAFIFRFPQFVDWPSPVWDHRDRVQLCVVRPNPFGAVLDELVRGETLKGRPLQLRKLALGDPIDSCHVLVLAAHRDVTIQPMLNEAAGRPILTIGDSDHFLDHGGIISMRVVDRRLRFDIDAANARRAGIQVSSQLLRLAVSVKGGAS